MTLSQKLVISLSVVIGLGGCATPPNAIHQLADKTAANAGVIAGHLDRLSTKSRALASERATRIAQLAAANAELRAEYNYDVALTDLGGGSARLAMIKDLEAWHKKVEEFFVGLESSEADRKAEVLTRYKNLTPMTDKLRKVAQSLSEIAKEDSGRDRVRFLAGFARELGKEIETDLEENEQAADFVKEMTGGLGGNKNDEAKTETETKPSPAVTDEGKPEPAGEVNPSE